MSSIMRGMDVFSFRVKSKIDVDEMMREGGIQRAYCSAASGVKGNKCFGWAPTQHTRTLGRLQSVGLFLSLIKYVGKF